ncbi:MAG: DUF1330 domain-containing protein [Alphaproteobacteria bacterium]|nr:DUF1330 domain-containing protein [Alphaproteobacteria bacterium]
MTQEKTIVSVTALPNPDEMEAMAEYAEKAHKLLDKTDATVGLQYSVKQTVHGKPGAIAGFIEFSSDQAVLDFFNGAEYMAVKPLRDKGFKSFDIHIVEQTQL